ncbi:MAG: DUF1552 domain-containing protein [Myxococcota bacterium]
MRSLINRRMFLAGVGGSTLAIPLLPSLAPKTARAQLESGPKRFFAFGTNHGGFRGALMAPPGAPDEVRSYGGQEIRRQQLVRTVDGNRAQISTMLRGAESRLTPTIVSKLNLLRGFYTPIHLGHNNGGMLGNYGAIFPEDEPDRVARWKPTIDQVLAYSPTFYNDLSTNLQRSLVVGDLLSYEPVNPSNPAAGVQKVNGEWNSLTLFDGIYEAPPDTGEEETRPSIVDRVVEDYRRTRDGQQIGAADRERLNDYMERLFELQRRVNVELSCGEVVRPATTSIDFFPPEDRGLSDAARFYELINDVFVVASLCDSCRVGTIRIGATSGFAEYSGNWHQDVVHATLSEPPNASPTNPHTIGELSYTNFFDRVFLDLANKLDQATDANGATILDNTLVVWVQESGPHTHASIDMTVVTAGGAGGHVQTGNYCDYRDLSRMDLEHDTESWLDHLSTGLLYNQFLGSCLQACDPDGGHGGYGDVVPHDPDNDDGGLRDQYLIEDQPSLAVRDEPLPFFLT